MTKINLTKYGFIKTPEEDFSDDGTRFTCYKPFSNSRLRISKATTCDEYFIAGRIIQGNLDYEEYSQLPHFGSMDALNGIFKHNLTEADLIQFYNDCLAYEQEYIEAESKIVYPTKEEIMKRRRADLNKYRNEYEYIKQHLSVDKLLSLNSSADFINIKRCLEHLKCRAFPKGTDEEYADSIYKTAFSRSFVKRPIRDTFSYEFVALQKILKLN